MHQKTGGNLPLMLDRLAASARDRNQFRGQFWAATAQGRITSIALALAAPALVLGYLIFQPEFAQSFLSDPRGWLFLGVVAVLETIGVIWVWRILKIDY
jgi:tight adherence protein B